MHGPRVKRRAKRRHHRLGHEGEVCSECNISAVLGVMMDEAKEWSGEVEVGVDAIHVFERDESQSLWRCVKPPVGGMRRSPYCGGCGYQITDEKISDLPDEAKRAFATTPPINISMSILMRMGLL